MRGNLANYFFQLHFNYAELAIMLYPVVCVLLLFAGDVSQQGFLLRTDSNTNKSG